MLSIRFPFEAGPCTTHRQANVRVQSRITAFADYRRAARSTRGARRPRGRATCAFLRITRAPDAEAFPKPHPRNILPPAESGVAAGAPGGATAPYTPPVPPPAGTIVLAIETSNPSAPPGAGSVAVGRIDPALPRGFRLLALRRLRPAARHDDALIRAVDDACRDASVAPRGLGRVAVSIGPGGFTSLRVAVATVKLLCEATGAQPVPVPSALVAAAKRRPAGRCAVALATKGETFWAAIVPPGAGDGAPVSGAVMTVADLDRAHRATPLLEVVADRHAPAALAVWARTAGVRMRPLWLCATRCLEASMALAPVDPLALAPAYPREPEAVRAWRARQVGVTDRATRRAPDA